MRGLRTYYLAWGIATILLLFLPQFLPLIYIHLATEILIYTLFAVSFNLLFGYGGLLPFGHVALFGVGAYMVAVILKHFPGMYLLLTLLMAALSGAVIAAIIGFFCLRLKGAYFALISLAFQMFLYAIAMKWRSLAYGDDGMTVNRPDLFLPVLGSVSMRSIPNVYYFTLVIVAIGILVCYLFLKTPLGNSLVCMRERDIRASYLGYNVFLTRFIVFSASGILAGLAGGLFVFFEEFVATSCIDLNMGISVVFMTVIGGPGHFLGPVLGAAFYIFFQDWISSVTRHWWVFMGIVFVVVVLYFEGGLISLFKNERVRFWVSHVKGS
jgi:branched-chain amino acid transport system permease protein